MIKKKWSKPECKRVKLVPEEAVLTGCKVKLGTGPSQNGCNAPGKPYCSDRTS